MAAQEEKIEFPGSIEVAPRRRLSHLTHWRWSRRAAGGSVGAPSQGIVLDRRPTSGSSEHASQSDLRQ